MGRIAFRRVPARHERLNQATGRSQAGWIDMLTLAGAMRVRTDRGIKG